MWYCNRPVVDGMAGACYKRITFVAHAWTSGRTDYHAVLWQHSGWVDPNDPIMIVWVVDNQIAAEMLVDRIDVMWGKEITDVDQMIDIVDGFAPRRGMVMKTSMVEVADEQRT